MSRNSPAHIESLERRSLLASSPANVLVSGHVDNVLTLTDDVSGKTRTTPLAGRRVFDDVNRDGKLNPSEPAALTNLDGRYQLKLSGGAHRLRIVGDAGWTVPAGGSAVRSVTLPNQSTVAIADGLIRVGGPTFTLAMSAPTTIDVAVAYTPAAADGRSDIAMLEVVRDLVADANRPYANSDTNVRLNVVRIARTNYDESGSLDADLDRLQDAADGKLDDVTKLRDRFRADLAVLLTGGDSDATSGETIGLAFEYLQVGKSDAFGFSAISLQNDDTGNNADWLTLAHEIGHNLGAGHDAASDVDANAITDWAYGYAYTGTDGKRYKDVMAYGSGDTLPFFSTPAYSWAGKAIGKRASADNARVIRSVAPSVSRYR